MKKLTLEEFNRKGEQLNTEWKKNHRYCQHCGAELSERLIEDGYDRKTGKKKVYLFMACPEYKEGLHGNSNHDKYMLNRPAESEEDLTYLSLS